MMWFKKFMTLRNLSYFMFFAAVVVFAYIAFFDFFARHQQNKMLSAWKSSLSENSKKPEKLLKVEKRGPKKDELGILYIPKLNMEQVVIYDATKENLIKGPSLIKSTAYPGTLGNAAIVGHRVSYGFPFRNLHKLKKGDKVIFQNSSGKFTYRVKRLFLVKPSDTSILKNTHQPQLTLLSCDPPFSARYRIVVIAAASNYRR